MNAPIARPSSSGRPGLSPFQNGILPGSPGAGTTTTRSRVMSSIRQRRRAQQEDLARAGISYTISSSSSPTRVPSGRNTPNRPRSGIVPPFVIASRPAPSRARTTSAGAIPDEPRPQLREAVARVAPGQQVEHGEEHVVATARRSWRRGGPPRRARRRATRRPRTSPRAAARARRAGSAGSASPRSGRRASARRRPRPRAGRRGTSGRSCRGSARRPDGRRGRSAAARSRPSPATPPGSPGRPRPCRCRARGTTWRRSRAGGPPSARPRPRAAARARASRGGRARGPRRRARSAARRAARRAGARSRRRSSSDARGSAPAACGWIDGQIEPATASAESRPGRWTGASEAARPSSAMSSTGHDHLELHRLAVPGVDDRHRPWAPSVVLAAEEPRDLLERTLRRRQADPLRRARR